VCLCGSRSTRAGGLPPDSPLRRCRGGRVASPRPFTPTGRVGSPSHPTKRIRSQQRSEALPSSQSPWASIRRKGRTRSPQAVSKAACASDRGCYVDTPIVDSHEDPHHAHRGRKPSSSRILVPTCSGRVRRSRSRPAAAELNVGIRTLDTSSLWADSSGRGPGKRLRDGSRLDGHRSRTLMFLDFLRI
jgi:hypothetical protein